MKKHFFRRIALVSVLASGLLGVSEAEARPPQSIRAEGTVLLIDHDTNTLVFKPGKGKKPLVLVWDKNSKLLKAGQPATSNDLKTGMTITIYYRRPFFQHPLLKKIVWKE